MGKLRNPPPATELCAHSSWSTNQQSKELTDTVRHYLIQQGTEYITHSVEIYRHSINQLDEHYNKVVTHIIGRQKQRKKIWYVCQPSNQHCINTSIYDSYDRFDSHMKQQHQPHIQCLNCDRTIHPAQYNKHYSVCCKLNDDNIANARNKQIAALINESTSDIDEVDDGNDEVDTIEQETVLVNDLDDYVPIQRNKRVGSCAYYNPLVRIESLQYYDINCPITADDHSQPDEFAEWAPKRCEKDSESCNIISHGTFVRFCYDTDEPFLIEIKRYKCTKHFNIKKTDKRSYITFNMLSECVDQQMNQLQTIRKTHDILVFESILITASLWIRIANISLITMNDSHCNGIIKHDYRRRWIRKYAMHMEYIKYTSMDATTHVCTAQQCYGLAMRQADEWLRLYSQITHRALDISVTRAIYHRNIVPQAVLQPAAALQHKIITELCTNSISMDHTFKMAKFGIYNIHDNTKSNRSAPVPTEVHTATSITTAEPIIDTGTVPSSDTSNELPNASVVHTNTRKRKYNQSVSYMKLTAQLLTVMDSNKLSLQCYVVPSGKTALQARMLEYLVSKQRAAGQIRINAVSVDNASQVAPTLKWHYTASTGQPLTVLQDLWHARERIEREFNTDHPLIKCARSEWRELIKDVILARCTISVWKDKMIAYRNKYTQPVTYSAVNQMAQISKLASQLIAIDPEQQHKKILSSNEMIDLYCRKNPGDIDDSNNVNYPVLRKPGVTALNNLIHDNNIDYIFSRTLSHCRDSTGTTANESFHRLCNSKISQSGGVRTFASAQQNMLVIQYQYNTNKLYKKGRYWCDIDLPNFSSIRQHYSDPLGEPDKDVLQRLEIEWSNMRWTAEHDIALDQLIIDLGTGKEYCHTKRLHYWLSTQPGLNGIAPKIIEKKLNAKLANAIMPTEQTIESGAAAVQLTG